MDVAAQGTTGNLPTWDLPRTQAKSTFLAAPAELESFLGEHYFVSAWSLYVAHVDLKAAELVHIGNLRDLEELLLIRAGVTDEGTARLAGVEAQKGRIHEGFDADFVVWDPDESFVVHAESLHQRHKLTPYAGRELFGSVKATYVCGQPAFGEL